MFNKQCTMCNIANTNCRSREAKHFHRKSFSKNVNKMVNLRPTVNLSPLNASVFHMNVISAAFSSNMYVEKTAETTFLWKIHRFNLMKLTTGANFSNILLTGSSHSFPLLTVWLCNVFAKEYGPKSCLWNVGEIWPDPLFFNIGEEFWE